MEEIRMTFNHIELEFQNVKDTNDTDLISFLRLSGEVKIQKSEITAKGVGEAILITLGIVGTWGAERYILDPLADNLDDWIKVMSSLEGKQFKILVNFESAELKSFET